MARKSATITIDASGRDHGKTFLLTEMPAARSEKWAMRAFLALAKGGVEIPDDVARSGLSGIAAIGLRAISNMSFADAEPLLDEMIGCVQIIPDPSRPQVVRALVADDVEEVATLIHLRKEVFHLHTGFSLPAAR